MVMRKFEELSPMEKMVFKQVKEELSSLKKIEHSIEDTIEKLDQLKELRLEKGEVINETCKRFGFKVQEVPLVEGGPYKLIAHNDPNVSGVMFTEHRDEYVMGMDMSSAKDYSVVNTLSEVNIVQVQPLLSITLDNEETVPKVIYKGKEITHKQSVSFEWETKTDVFMGGLTYAIEHINGDGKQPVSNKIERRLRGHI